MNEDHLVEGAVVYFRLNKRQEGSECHNVALKGTIEDIQQKEHKSLRTIYRIKVSVYDNIYTVGMGRTPDHVAPKEYQPDDMWAPPDYSHTEAYGNDLMTEETYNVPLEKIIEIVERPYNFVIEVD